MSEPAHYKRGPSGGHRWLICTDSPEAEEGYPDSTSDAADEGTAAHWLLEQCLLTEQSPEKVSEELGGVILAGPDHSGCEKDWPITGEMIEAVQVHIDAVEKHSKKRGTKLFVEERVHIGDHFGLQDTVGGTADTIMWLPKSKTLIVLDFKYGRGHVVEVHGKAGNIYEYDETTGKWNEVSGPEWTVNPQIGLYAIAAMHQLERLLGKKVEVKWIELGIVQPRAYHKKGPVRTKKISPMQLMNLEGDLIEAVNGPKVRIPGEHCYFCRAKPDCEPYHAARGGAATAGFEGEVPETAETAETTETTETPNPHHHEVVATATTDTTVRSLPDLVSRPVKGLALHELAAARCLLPTLKAWAKEIEEEIRTRWLNDLPVPGTKLVQGPGRRSYGGTKEEIDQAAIATAQTLGIEPYELFEPSVPKSPAQLEKQLGKAKFKHTPLANLVATTAGGPVVVDADSDKPEYVKDGGFEAEAPPETVEHPLL